MGLGQITYKIKRPRSELVILQRSTVTEKQEDQWAKELVCAELYFGDFSQSN